ncbi:RHO1 GDP-GTP exchange protein 2 [Apophysomyces ossiformis]|uniref:RHO1 GDP-GTP exchange protein 2 n=1 Tax=Apophysomyces ossiformis TaxID=679940 RepID=A0A8H7BV86_9FUNG|nr:RHO1 GDP-GTP exchange protein 2 [Apophysomyces ossiformis]
MPTLFLIERQDKPLVDEILAQRSRSFAYGSHPSSNTRMTQNATTKSSSRPSSSSSTILSIYPALLSRVAAELKQRIVLGDRVKNGIEYKNAFDGQEAVDKITQIARTTDRLQALRLGRALGVQRLFHDVNYESRLIDSCTEIYQFDDRAMHCVNESPMMSPGTMTTSSSSVSDFFMENASVTTSHHDSDTSDDSLPNGVFTELTHCYSPACHGKKPCYSYTCPKRLRQPKRVEFAGSELTRSSSSANLRQQTHELWADVTPKDVLASVSHQERKRQETIFELIYTEDDFVKDLEYLNTMWIEPLRNSDVIPIARRETFIQKVFCNVMSIHAINSQLVAALKARQKETPIVSQIGDIMLEFVQRFEPYIQYGARQHEAKYELEYEKYVNKDFDAFAESTERHPSSLKLELNGYLTKPTTRLGRYSLLLNEILKHTPEDHADHVKIPEAVDVIKRFLERVNAEAGKAKNRFDLERIHRHLSFKHKIDEMDLHLLDEARYIYKQGTLRKSPNLDSTEYQVILFDHYLVVAKVKMINAIEHYIIQKRPIPIELLSVTIPDMTRVRRSSSILPSKLNGQSSNGSANGHAKRSTDTSMHSLMNGGSVILSSKTGYPISFQHLGRKGSGNVTLYAPSIATRKPWFDKIHKLQVERDKRQPIFDLCPAVREREFYVDTKINHMITFNGGQQYLLATDNGVYVGHTTGTRTPHKVLSLDRVTQVQVLEAAELLLVLADKVLWEYGLDVVNSKPEDQVPGRKVQSHVPFFHVGQCLHRTLVCVPRVSTLQSTITAFEPAKPMEFNRKQGLLERLVRAPSPSDLHLKRFKDCYIPSEAWAVELSSRNMLITGPRGIIVVDMRTDKPQDMLNPDDKQLKFVTDREKEEAGLHLRPSIKRIALFSVPSRDCYFVCYDEYGFYINGKGNRVYPNFLIEWEGHPEHFAFVYPYVIAFDHCFIEIRHVETGQLEQVIRGHNIRCLNNGHKAEVPLIFGVMCDPRKDTYHFIFNLKLHSTS